MRALHFTVLLATAALGQTMYRWTDSKGEAHYTDDVSTIPRGVKAVTTEGDEVNVVPAAPTLKAAAAPPAAPKPAPKGYPEQKGPVEVTLTKVSTELSADDRAYIEQAIAAASRAEGLAAWGGLRLSVHVEVATLERIRAGGGDSAFGLATGLDQVLLRAPKDTVHGSWPLDYRKTVVHELGHLLEHQVAGQNRPRWFAEGFANTVAGFPGYGSADDVAWWTIRHGGERPLDKVMSAAPMLLAYAVATAAVSYLIELVGVDGVKKMLALRGEGDRFDDAFKTAAGFSVEEFQKRFIEHVRPQYHERAELPGR